MIPLIRTTLFIVLSALCIVSQSAHIVAQDDPKKHPPRKEKPAASLKVGDSAPALMATKWLQGDAVRTFEPGKIYVVHFWAPWCAACCGNMPHLAELHARYKDQGATIIGFTSRSIRGVPDNTEKKVAAFVKRHGPALPYTFAYADDSTTPDAWLKASGQQGFCTFVVDKTGRIAYMGHSMFLDLVLIKVVASGANAKQVGDDMAKVVAEYQSIFEGLARDYKGGGNFKSGLNALKAFEVKYPSLADLPPIVQAKLSLLPKHGNPGEGKEYADVLVAKAIKQKNVRLLGLAYSILRNEKDRKEFLSLAMRVAEAHVRIDGGRDAQSLLNLGEAYLVVGDKAKAREYAQKAIMVAATESADFQEYVEKEARRLGALADYDLLPSSSAHSR